MSRKKPEWPKTHGDGAYGVFGFTEHEDGTIEISSGLADRVKRASLEIHNLEQTLAAINRSFADLLRPHRDDVSNLWAQLRKHVPSFNTDDFEYTFNPADGVVTRKPKAGGQ